MKNLKRLKVGIVAVSMVFSSFAQDKLVIKGSDTLGAKMIPKIAEAYENKNPGSKFEIAAEGSSTGIAAIIDGTAHIGMSSRELKGKEKAAAGANGVRLVKTVVANDAVAIIVNESNLLSKISLKDVERIFTGDITNWSAVGVKAVVYQHTLEIPLQELMHFSKSLHLQVVIMDQQLKKWLETSKLQRKFPRTQMELVMSVWPMLVRQELR